MKVLKIFQRHRVIVRLWSVLLSLLSLSIQASVHNEYTREMLAKQAEEFVLSQLQNTSEDSQLEVNASPLDKRIKPKNCSQQLELKLPQNSVIRSRNTVQVKCSDSVGWSLYVVVTVKRMQAVVVAGQSIAPGTILTINNLSIQNKDKTLLRGYTISDPSIIIGAKARKHISLGQAITSRHVCTVCKGDSVSIVVKLNGLTVKTSGIAQQDGNIGDMVLVLNKSSKRVVEAQVSKLNQVIIGL